MRSNTCPLCGEGWPEQHDWITDEMVERGWERLQETGAPEGPTLLVIDRADLRAALESALKASPGA